MMMILVLSMSIVWLRDLWISFTCLMDSCLELTRCVYLVVLYECCLLRSLTTAP